MASAMFCRQCEQAARGVGCDVMGNCGKNPEVSALLDLMIHGLQGVALYASKAREAGRKDEEVDRFMLDGLFTRVTNVNFDPDDIARRLHNCFRMKEKAKALYEQGGQAPQLTQEAANWQPAGDTQGLIAQGRQYGVLTWHQDPNILSTIAILIYGLLGMGAFAWHATEMEKENSRSL